MRSHLFITLIAGMILFSCKEKDTYDNSIKLGNAEVIITVIGDMPQSVEGQVVATPLLDMESESYPFMRDGRRFCCSVPTETERVNVAVMLYATDPPKPIALGIVELSQQKPLEISAQIVSADSIKYELSDNNGVNAFGLTNDIAKYSSMMQEIEMRFAYGPADDFKPYRVVSPKEYMSWESVKEIYDSLYVAQYDFAYNNNRVSDEIRKLLDNEFRMFYAANYYLNYHTRALREANIDRIPEYPDEFYSSLNEIDYANILNHGPAISPFYFLQKILSDLPVWIEPIGETPIDEWKTNSKKRLDRIIKSPSPILIDLLSAVSYLQQINDNEVLTDIQIANINDGYDSDLGKIILARNNMLVEKLAQSANLYDYSDKKFDLDQFIAEHYANKPVIIDFWNSWCSPCMAAHKEVNKIKDAGECEGVVFLYLSNTSSNEKVWKKHAPLIGGEQVRLNDEDWNKLCERFGIDAIPYYIVMDKDHNIYENRVGFPGIDGYRKWLNSIR